MIVYSYKNSLYINLTNRCPCKCRYCIKYKWRWKFRGHSLKLKKEPSPLEVVKEVKKIPELKEVVFCGYGEPFVRFDAMKEISAQLKTLGKTVRINTTGLGNLANGRNTLPELAGLVDIISISLNSDNEKDYVYWNNPAYGGKSFQAVLDFIVEAKKYIPEVVVTAVNLPGTDIEKIRKIVDSLGVSESHFRERPYLDEYENR